MVDSTGKFKQNHCNMDKEVTPDDSSDLKSSMDVLKQLETKRNAKIRQAVSALAKAIYGVHLDGMDISIKHNRKGFTVEIATDLDSCIERLTENLKVLMFNYFDNE